jgi:hypothetical protein
MATYQSRGVRKSTACCMQIAAALIAYLLALATASGCSGPSWTDRGEETAPERVGGIVAASPSAEERERRAVMQRLLEGIVAGEDIAMVARWLPGVEFRESQAAFFNGNLLLRRWEFAASFRPDGIPVALEFIPADDATANRIERRTYEVTGWRGAWVIDRVAVERLVP